MSKKCLGQKEFGPKDFVQKKLLTKIKAPKILGPKSLVKMGSITAEISLICTNVAGTYAAWTNVIMTVGLCETWSKKPTFKVWSTSGH